MSAPARHANRRAAAPSLLLELGTEELPPKALRSLGMALAAALRAALQDAGLLGADSGQRDRWFATPRRLAVLIPGVLTRQSDHVVERRGPALSAAFDATGAPTKAALGFARSCGVPVEQLERIESAKGSWLGYREIRRGERAAQLIPDCVNQALGRLPIPKRMRWGAGAAEFVRPVHWVVLLHGSRVVPATVLSVPTDRFSRGHRYHAPDPLKIGAAEEYEETLAKHGRIVPDFDRRRALIRRQLGRQAARCGSRIVIDEALLDEVSGLVELPRAMLGNIDPEFMVVPEEVLVSSMQDHQKYFHLTDETGRLAPHFITVSNIRSKRPRRVREGNERVLRARLADAKFFWVTDRQTPLASRVEALNQVLFHDKLGTVHDKTMRLCELARRFAELAASDAPSAERAAFLSKADLVSDMVAEFPGLQGTMGRYYAAHDGEPEAVAKAIEDHYRPRFAGDALPTTATGSVVALADKLDTLVGIFATGEEPSGDRDPFALRRSALGVLRILIEEAMDLDLEQLIAESIAVYTAHAASLPDAAVRAALNQDTQGRIVEFFLDRLHSYYAEAGFASDEIAAVRACRPTRPRDFDRRLRAVAQFRRLAEAQALTQANKRIRNILRKANETPPSSADPSCYSEPAEHQLAERIGALAGTVEPLLAKGDYGEALTALAGLRDPIDRFFDDVMVMTDDPALRSNRLALLAAVERLFVAIADISKLQG